MSETIDKMLGLTAEIADTLLAVKDSGNDAIPDSLKLKIINLVELASAVPSGEIPADNPENDPENDPEDNPEEDVEQEENEAIEKDEELEDSEAIEKEEVLEESEAVEKEQEEMVEDEEIITATLEEEEEEADLKEDGGDITEEEADATDSAKETPVEAAVSRPRLSVTELTRSFSVNDLFLFRREIFHGDKAAFDNALEQIAALDNDRRYLQYYLVENLDLNLNESPGKEFYESLLRFFK